MTDSAKTFSSLLDEASEFLTETLDDMRQSFLSGIEEGIKTHPDLDKIKAAFWDRARHRLQEQDHSALATVMGLTENQEILDVKPLKFMVTVKTSYPDSGGSRTQTQVVSIG